jgi:hypothetical protein
MEAVEVMVGERMEANEVPNERENLREMKKKYLGNINYKSTFFSKLCHMITTL